MLQRYGVDIQPLQPLGQLTIYAVQFHYDPNPQPLNLDHEEFQQQVQNLLSIVESMVHQGPG